MLSGVRMLRFVTTNLSLSSVLEDPIKGGYHE